MTRDNIGVHLVAPPKYETQAATDYLDGYLNIGAADRIQQDWDVENADGKRLAEFCDLYCGDKLDVELKFALMKLIIASLDNLFYADGHLDDSDQHLAKRVETMLRHDFILHFYTLHYWCLFDEEDINNVFGVTPMLRVIWADCFKPEYQTWIDNRYN